MRLFNFLSKFAFICNLAFLLFVFFRWIEMRKPVNTTTAERVAAVPFLKDLIITLGVCAIVINLLINIFYLMYLLRGRLNAKPLWLPIINFIFFLLQVFYFFFY